MLELYLKSCAGVLVLFLCVEILNFSMADDKLDEKYHRFAEKEGPGPHLWIMETLSELI